MRIKKWLTVNSGGAARLTTGRPSMHGNEISIFLELEIPDALFRKPRLSASIEIPKEAAAPETITANVVENVQEAIKTVTGLDFHVRVIQDEEEEKV